MTCCQNHTRGRSQEDIDMKKAIMELLKDVYISFINYSWMVTCYEKHIRICCQERKTEFCTLILIRVLITFTTFVLFIIYKFRKYEIYKHI